MTPTALGSAAEFLNAYPLENAKGIYEGQRVNGSEQASVFINTFRFCRFTALCCGDLER